MSSTSICVVAKDSIPFFFQATTPLYIFSLSICCCLGHCEQSFNGLRGQRPSQGGDLISLHVQPMERLWGWAVALVLISLHCLPSWLVQSTSPHSVVGSLRPPPLILLILKWAAASSRAVKPFGRDVETTGPLHCLRLGMQPRVEHLPTCARPQVRSPAQPK
jgi:hypothetical protein